MEEQQGGVVAALLLAMEVVCPVPALTPYHHLCRQSWHVPSVLDSLTFPPLHGLWPHLGQLLQSAGCSCKGGVWSVSPIPRESFRKEELH